MRPLKWCLPVKLWVPPAPEATNTSLTDSVFFAAEMLGLSSQQVDHLKVAMANLDHRSYVHILQVLRAAAKAATTAATLSVPAKVFLAGHDHDR